MKLSNLKTIVYVGLALFYLYIIAANVFRNVEGMTTTIETIENKKEGATSGDLTVDLSKNIVNTTPKKMASVENTMVGKTNEGKTNEFVAKPKPDNTISNVVNSSTTNTDSITPTKEKATATPNLNVNPDTKKPKPANPS